MRRRTYRIKTLFAARCFMPDPPHYCKGIIRDVGLPDTMVPGRDMCGCSLSLFEVVLQPGATFHLVMFFPDRDIALEAVMCREKAGGLPGEKLYGVEFTNLADDDRKYLEDWVVAHAQEVEFPEVSCAEDHTVADGQYTG